MAVNWNDFEPTQPIESKPDQEATNWDDFEPTKWSDFEPVTSEAAPAVQQAPTSADPVPADTLIESIEKKVVNTADRWKGIGGGLISMAGDDKGALENITRPLLEAEQEGRDPGFFDYYKSAFNAVTSGSLLSSLQKQAIDKESIGGKFLSSMSETGRKITEDANKELAANRVETDSLGVELASDIVGGTIDMLPMLIAGRIGGPTAAGVVFGGQVAGHTYGESVGDKGRTQGEALNAVKFDMLAEWIPEKFMVIDTLLKPGTSFIKRTINATLGEGAQEALTEVLQSAYDDVTLEDMSIKDAIMNLDWERVAKASAIGAGVGFSLAGPAHLLDKAGRPPAYDQTPGEPITPTHKVAGGIDAVPVTKKGVPVPDTFIDATGKIHRDTSAVEQPIIQPSSFDAGSLDANVQMDAIKAEVMGDAAKPVEQPVIEPTFEQVNQQAIDKVEQTISKTDIDEIVPPSAGTGTKVLKEPVTEPVDVVAVEKQEAIDEAAHEAATSPENDRKEPSVAQKEVENYKTGDIPKDLINDLDVKIENPKGSYRFKIDTDQLKELGKTYKGVASAVTDLEDSSKIPGAFKKLEALSKSIPALNPIIEKGWFNEMKSHYGKFVGTIGSDLDPVDVFLGDKAHDETLPVFVVDQVNEDGSYDEHKFLVGYENEAAARQGYLENYDKGWTGLGAISELSLDELKTWLADGDTKAPYSKEVPRLSKEEKQAKTDKDDTLTPVPVEQVKKDEGLLSMPKTSQQFALLLPGLQSEVYEEMAKIESSDGRSEEKRQLQELRGYIQKTGVTPSAAMRKLWGRGLTDAPRGLQQATGSELVVPPVPSESTQGEGRGADVQTTSKKILPKKTNAKDRKRTADLEPTPKAPSTEEIKKTIGESELAKRGKAQQKAKQGEAEVKQAKELNLAKELTTPKDLAANNYAILNGKKISYDVEIEDTGETVKYTEDAGEAMRTIDDRIEKLKALLNCL